MKKFETLSEQELVALTDDEIQRYIDYACADAGVPLLPALVSPPAVVRYEPDAKIYTLGYHMHFATAEDAMRVQEAIKASHAIEVEYLSTPSGVTSHALSRRSAPRPALQVEDAFSVERAESLKRDLADAKSAEDVYERAKKEFEQAVKARENYTDEVHEAVTAARELHRRREERRRNYQRYLDLAEGNADIASRFLENAHGDARQLLPELFPDVHEDTIEPETEVVR